MRALTCCAVSQNSWSGTCVSACQKSRSDSRSRQWLTELAIEEAAPDLRQEGRHVHAIGHVADRILFRGTSGQ